MTELALVVVYAADADATVQFYERLGIRFELERHGNGPEHHSVRLGTTVFEIYPTRSEQTRVRLGFAIDDLDGTCEEFGDAVVQPITDSPWGRRAVLIDPNGNRVELTERTTP